MKNAIRHFTVGLASIFQRGPWEKKAIAERVNSVLTPVRRRAWILRLVKRTVAAFPGERSPRAMPLIRFFERDEELIEFVHFGDIVVDGQPGPPQFDVSRFPQPSMQPIGEAAASWKVCPLLSDRELADWLGLTFGELDWFADLRQRNTRANNHRLEHYRYRWIPKATGGHRLLEIPKPRLKQIQRQILADILDFIPPHAAAHAFRNGHSIASYVKPHTDKRVVLHIDLREFFPSVTSSQVQAIFWTAGYPDQVTTLLEALCTNVTSATVLNEFGNDAAADLKWKRYRSRHLPQGAPTSPALANLAAYRLDCRLSALAQKVGADYTRYADDMIISGGTDFEHCLSRFRVLVAAIIHHEGFEIRHRKTRCMKSGNRQQVAGIVLNKRMNIPRHEYDNLRALLYNCIRFGPTSQNCDRRPRFRAHLAGRIAYWSMICPDRCQKMVVLFDAIKWGEIGE